MTPDSVLDIFRNAIYITSLIITVVIAPSLIVGVLIAIFQAATQINEMSLSFIPKLMITFFVLGMTGPWLLKLVVNYTSNLISEIPNMIG